MTYPISPWSQSVERVSPDGRYVAIISETMEFAMGSAVAGGLVISEKALGGRVVARVANVNPSFVWSSDSRALALWQCSRSGQKLCVVSIPRGTVRCIDADFRSLQLHRFDQGVLSGIDSPDHMPRRFERPVSDLIDKLD